MRKKREGDENSEMTINDMVILISKGNAISYGFAKQNVFHTEH